MRQQEIRIRRMRKWEIKRDKNKNNDKTKVFYNSEKRINTKNKSKKRIESKNKNNEKVKNQNKNTKEWKI